MKHLTIFLSLFLLMSPIMLAMAESGNDTVYLYESDEENRETENDEDSEENKIEKPDSGPRSGIIPLVCRIDFINNCLVGPSVLNDVEEYVIWDETGTICLCVLFDETSFVETLKEMPSSMTYLLVLRGSGFRLSGYFYK